MIVTINADGINFTLGLKDQQIIKQATVGMLHTPRDVIEALAANYTTELERAVVAAVEGLNAARGTGDVSA